MKKSEVKAVFKSDIQTVWNAVTDNTQTNWRSDLSAVEITGKNTFTEIAKNGFRTFFTITEKKNCERYAFDMDNRNFSGRWSGVFRAVPEGTEVIFTEELQVKNPVMRVLAALFMNVKKFQRLYIADLKTKLGEAEEGKIGK